MATPLVVESQAALSRALAFIGAFALAGMIDDAAAQDISQSITKTARALREASEPSVVLLSTLPAPQPAATQDLTIGLGYEKADGDGHSLTVPLQYGYLSANKQWNVRVESGIARVSDASGSLSGMTSVTLLGSRTLAQATAPTDTPWKVLGTVGLGVPTHGNLGGDTYSQQARLIGLASTGPWTGVLAGVVVHLNGQPDGVASTVKVLHGELHYGLPNTDALIVKLDRSVRKGAGGNTSATFEYDHTFSNRLEADLLLTRGLTTGTRSTGIEFDLVYRF